MSDKQVSDKIILKIVDTFDEATKLYYQTTINEELDNTSVTNYRVSKKRTNYYECLLKMFDVFMGKVELDIENPELKQIDDLLLDLESDLASHGVTNEEMRRALLLLDINGFKNLNFSLDIITPDAVGLIIVYFLKVLYNENEKINLLDFNFGVGNLAFNIINAMPNDIHLLGIENHQLLVDVATHKAEMMSQELNIYFQDALEYLINDLDLVVTDLATYDYENDKYESMLYLQGVRYFPYLAIEKYLNLNDFPLYIYLINNDFFSQKGSNEFKKMLEEKGSIIEIVVLPSSLFLNEKTGKSLLFMDKELRPDTEAGIYILPNPNNQELFVTTLNSAIENVRKKYHK